MKTTSIVKHIAVICALGVAASSQAQLLGAGLGRSIGGSLGGAGSIGGAMGGGQIGGMGSVAGRGSLMSDVRASRVTEAADQTRRQLDASSNANGSLNVAKSLDLQRRAQGDGAASANGSLLGGVAGSRAVNVAPASLSGSASGAANGSAGLAGGAGGIAGASSGSAEAAGSIDTNLVAQGRGVVQHIGDGARPVADGARNQIAETRGFVRSTAANARATAQGTTRAAVAGARELGQAASAVQVEKSVNVSASGEARGSASRGQ